MPNIRTSVEAKRGCGYRKPGGLYLVSGNLTAPCGKLPIELHVCTTCGGGIKPQRAWQTIKPRLLFSAAECRNDNSGGVWSEPSGLRIARGGLSCAGCIVGGAMPEKGGLLWVGGAFYKTPEDFMREARTMGISRRIPTVPKDLEVGKTVVYLAHRQVPFWTVTLPDGTIEKLALPDNRPAVFSAFVPRAVEYVVKGDEADEELERIEKRGIELVKVEREQGELFGPEDDDDDEDDDDEEAAHG